MKKRQKIKTTKYPRALAEAETKSRRSYNSDIVHVMPEADRELLTLPSAFSLQNVYPYIFDGLTALCTDYANTTFTFEGKETRVIQGQDEPALTHLQAIVPVDVFKTLALNGHNEYWNFLEKELFLMHKKPERRLLPIAPGLLIGTHPLQVDFIYEDGTRASMLKRLDNIGADRKIRFLVLRFYKPLFFSILQNNSKGTIGNNYLQLPRAMQAEINSTLKLIKEHFSGMQEIYEFELKNDMKGVLEHLKEEFNLSGPTPLLEDYTEKLEAITSLSATDARNIFLFLACHDNKQSPYIDIGDIYDEFVIGCFPGLAEIRKSGKVYIKPENVKILNKKMDGFTWLYSFMAKMGKLNGAQFVPIVYNALNKRVEVQRNKNLCYNAQPEFKF